MNMETNVSEMSVSELRQLISEVVHEELAALTDPDYGLELREDFVERMKKQQEAIDNGTAKLIPFDELLDDLGISETELAGEAHEVQPAG